MGGRAEHHCIKTKEAWQTSVREYTALLERLEGPGGYLSSLKDHVCAPQKKLAIEKMYLTQPSENYKF